MTRSRCPRQTLPEMARVQSAIRPARPFSPPRQPAAMCQARRGWPALQSAGAKFSKPSNEPRKSGIDLEGRNPVDLECDRLGRISCDKPDPDETFCAHRQIDDHVHGLDEADGGLDVGDRLAIDEIGDAI